MPQNKPHYIHRLSYSAQERLVGVFVLIGITILVTLLLLSSQHTRLFQGRVEFTAYMRNPLGVNTDTRVHISGIEAGSVKRISVMPDNSFKIVLNVYEDFHTLVRSDSTASISKLAFIGDSVIDISPGTASLELLPDGGVLAVKETLTLDQILANLKPVLEKINNSIDKVAALVDALPNDAIHATLQDTAVIANQVRQISEHMGGGQGALGALIYDKEVRTDMVNTWEQTAQVTQNAQMMMAEISELVQTLKETTDIIRQQIQQLPAITLKTRKLIEDTQSAVDALSHTWPISGNIPQQPEAALPPPLPSND